MWVEPNISRTTSHTILRVIEITLNTSCAGKLCCTLEARGTTVNTLGVIKDVGVDRAFQVADILINVRVYALCAVGGVSACVAI